MSRVFIAFVLWSALAGPAAAMSCSEEIEALYKGGPIDPFARGSWRDTTIQYGPDGAEKHVIQSVWQSPSRVLSITNGQYIIAIGANTWTAGSKDGPWTNTGRTLPEDIEAFHQATNDALMRNLTEAMCPGTEMLEGREVTKYVFRTKTDPNEYGSWFGGVYTAFIDIQTNRLVRMDITDSVASWATEPSKDIYVSHLTYDDTIKVDPPQ